MSDDFDAVMAKMREGYRAKLPAKAEELAALLDGDATEVVKYLHRLGGTAGSYGITDVSGPALALEAELKAGAELGPLRPRIEELIELLRAS